MTDPCTKSEVIERIDKKLDTLIDLQIDNATIHQQLIIQSEKIDDHEGRIRRIEKTPIRVLYWIAGIAATVIGGFFMHSLWG